jgi:hypothetical protein
MRQQLGSIVWRIAHEELVLRLSSCNYHKNARFVRTLIIIIIIIIIIISRSSVGGIMTRLRTEWPGIRIPVVATDFFSEHPDRLWVPFKAAGAWS